MQLPFMRESTANIEKCAVRLESKFAKRQIVMVNQQSSMKMKIIKVTLA